MTYFGQSSLQNRTINVVTISTQYQTLTLDGMDHEGGTLVRGNHKDGL